jgi:hypothetical protein
MNPGSFMWHVKGRTNDGVETGWSVTWSFGIATPPAPTPTSIPTPTSGPPTPTPTNTPCPYRNNYGQFPTFYAQQNYQGQSVTFYFNPGEDKFFVLPSGIQGNLQSFTDPYGAFHIVTYHGVNHDGNMAHWDANNPGPLPNTDGYQRTDSVEIYFRRC